MNRPTTDDLIVSILDLAALCFDGAQSNWVTVERAGHVRSPGVADRPRYEASILVRLGSHATEEVLVAGPDHALCPSQALWALHERLRNRLSEQRDKAKLSSAKMSQELARAEELAAPANEP